MMACGDDKLDATNAPNRLAAKEKQLVEYRGNFKMIYV
jgi:hypothetical protein